MERNSSGALRAPGAFGTSGTSDSHVTLSSCSLHITHVCWLAAVLRPSAAAPFSGSKAAAPFLTPSRPHERAGKARERGHNVSSRRAHDRGCLPGPTTRMSAPREVGWRRELLRAKDHFVQKAHWQCTLAMHLVPLPPSVASGLPS
jgi:hypothetical protein